MSKLKQLIMAWLTEHDYDGLYCDEGCCCSVRDGLNCDDKGFPDCKVARWDENEENMLACSGGRFDHYRVREIVREVSVEFTALLQCGKSPCICMADPGTHSPCVISGNIFECKTTLITRERKTPGYKYRLIGAFEK